MDLKSRGLTFMGTRVAVSVTGMSCDAPATTFLLNIATHNAYYGCRKCTTKGSWVRNVYKDLAPKRGGRVTYPDIDAILRTDCSFRNRSQIQHHDKNGIRSIIEDIFYDIVKAVVIDPMHCVYIGVHKKLVGIWFNDPFDNVRMSAEQLSKISMFREWLRQYVPSDFVRKPRSVKDFPRWKATEHRLDLNYLGPIVYKFYLNQKCYDHFILLHVAIRLLSNKDFCHKYANYANDLLRLFVRASSKIYGDKFVSFNVHCLIHLVEDVKNHGSLDEFSAFCYENKLQVIKNMLKKSGRPLQQIVRRLDEENRVLSSLRQSQCINLDRFTLQDSHCCGPMVEGLTCVEQFKKLSFKNTFISSCIPDNCVFIDDASNSFKVVLVQNWIRTSDREILLLGRRYLKHEDLYTYPLPSSQFHEIVVSRLSNALECYSLTSVKFKAVHVPTTFPETGSFLVNPLMNINVN